MLEPLRFPHRWRNFGAVCAAPKALLVALRQQQTQRQLREHDAASRLLLQRTRAQPPPPRQFQ